MNKPPASGESFEREFIEIRKEFAGIFKWIFWLLIVLLLLFVLAMFLVIGTDKVTSVTLEKLGLAVSLQVALGMILGFACVFYGLVMTWLGITAGYSASASVEGTGVRSSFNVLSTAPGIIFFVGGVVLIAMSLYKPVKFEQKPQEFVPVPFSQGPGNDFPPPMKPPEQQK